MLQVNFPQCLHPVNGKASVGIFRLQSLVANHATVPPSRLKGALLKSKRATDFYFLKYLKVVPCRTENSGSLACLFSH